MFLKNRNIISKIKRSKVTDYAALKIDERRSKSMETEFSFSHLSPDWRQMTIENAVSSIFLSAFFDFKSVFDYRLSSMLPVITRYRSRAKLWLVTLPLIFVAVFCGQECFTSVFSPSLLVMFSTPRVTAPGHHRCQ